MKKSAAHFYTPSDLVDFFCCHHATFLNETMQKNSLVQTQTDLLLQKKGLEHEKAYLEKLKKEGGEVVEIPSNRPLQELSHLTYEAARSGVDIIYQARLCQPSWQGNTDFLIKCKTPSNLGAFSYEALDTKLAHNPEPKYILQLCIYSHLLTAFQGLQPQKMHLYLGNKSQHSFNVRDFIYYCSHIREKFERFMKSLPEKSSPEPCSHCQLCQWKDICAQEWKEKDHLSLVANIRRLQADKLRKAGIQTVANLAAIPKNYKIKGLNQETLIRLQSQAFLQTQKARTGKPVYKILNSPADRGLSRLPKPNEGDLFFDIEGDPFYPNGLEYLLGIYCPIDKNTPLKQFWSHNHQEEKKSFKLFMDFIERHLGSYPKSFIYHYNHYEPTALKRLACRYALREEFLDNLLRQQKFIDLYPVVKESLRTSETGYSLKNMEIFYMKKREDSVSTALDSIVMYNNWRESGYKQLLKNIADYNATDCISSRNLRDWLLTLKPHNTPWFKDLSDENTKEPIERKEWEKEYEHYQKRLGEMQKDKEMSERLCSLLEFHNREIKSQWWGFFERQNKEEEELIEDRDCLAGLTLVEEPIKEDRFLIYKYQFPPQEHRLKIGSVINTATLQTAGNLIHLDDLSCTVQIKRHTKKERLPERFSIGPEKPLNIKGIRSAIYRFAQSAIEDEKSYPCVRDLLKRSLPRITDHKKSAPLMTSNNLSGEALKIVSRLDNSYLFIQGPPGTGKTYTSSHIIVELIKQGKKIGVTANSHKAIHNVLKHIERTATQENFSFHGIKKASNKREETFFKGRFIESKCKTIDIPLEADLLAGTVWLFSHERFTNHLDYLFIDEAGQIALANVIAMGLSTKNIVLVGDQMQLGQPIQGTHPGEAGLSVLEFLLNRQTVIPQERGLFLNTSYRLNQSLCDFISDAFYEGKLKTHISATKRKLIINEDLMPNEGIVFIAAKHEGCSQKSLKEAQIIKDQYRHLKGQLFQDKNSSSPRPLTEEDILVVAPYNAQVNCLKAFLPEKARVGTIDKFQGQEAAVVLISMATSSGEDIPRNIEFLFSRNRLNVALSRAQCLAILVASPKLLEINSKTIEQMKQLNTFCQLKERAFYMF